MKVLKSLDGLFEKGFRKELAKVALPIAVQSFMLSAVAVADTLMLGSVEQNSMSAVSLATKIQFIQNIIISTLVAALIVLGAQYWGKKDTKSVDKLFWTTVKLSGGTSLLFFIGCEFFPQYLMLAFTNDEELISLACPYLKIAAWSYLISGFSQCWLALLKITDHAKDTAVIGVTTVILNIALNALLIFGLFFFPEMKAEGAALATTIARLAELVWAVGLTFRKGHIRPAPRDFFLRDKGLTHDFIKCMLPLLGAGLLWGVGFTAYSALMGHIDQNAPAANSVSGSVIELVCCACNGLASGGGILVGNALGAGELARGKSIGIRVAALGWLCGIATSLVMLLLTPVILGFVKLNETAAGYLKDMLIVMSVYTVGRVVNTVMINGIFAAGGDTMFDMYSLAVTMWGIALPLAALGTFAFSWPVWMIYACTCLDEVGKIPWVIYHFRKYKWVKDLTRENAQ